MIVAITDRRLMGADTPGAFATAIARAIAGLAIADVIIQVREKDLDGGALLAFVRAAMTVGSRVVVNDRVDVALAAGAAGVHLPERGLAIADARALLGPHALIGVSRHASGADVAGADLVQLGPIFDTPGKGPALGVAALAGWPIPVIAVGGIDSPERAAAARTAGAAGVAVIRAAWSGRLPL